MAQAPRPARPLLFFPGRRGDGNSFTLDFLLRGSHLTTLLLLCQLRMSNSSSLKRYTVHFHSHSHLLLDIGCVNPPPQSKYGPGPRHHCSRLLGQCQRRDGCLVGEFPGNMSGLIFYLCFTCLPRHENLQRVPFVEQHRVSSARGPIIELMHPSRLCFSGLLVHTVW